jgi:hypothetical protein
MLFPFGGSPSSVLEFSRSGSAVAWMKAESAMSYFPRYLALVATSDEDEPWFCKDGMDGTAAFAVDKSILSVESQAP